MRLSKPVSTNSRKSHMTFTKSNLNHGNDDDKSIGKSVSSYSNKGGFNHAYEET